MSISNELFLFISTVIIFAILIVLGTVILNKIRNSSNRFLNPEELLPKDELPLLKQLFYLIIMSGAFISIVYILTFIYTDVFYFVIFDVIISLIIAIDLDKSSWKNKILILLVVPYGSLYYLLCGFTLVGLIDLIHIPVLIYFIKVYYDKFQEYTTNNRLGYTILLLFIIVFISFIITQLAEGVTPLDSMVMVSNAFTSNGYAILGKTVPGKINSLLLVWSGYIIAGAGTAALTSAVLIRHFNKRLKRLEELINEGSEE